MSTSSAEDLSLENNELIRFCRELPGLPEESLLAFKNKWSIESPSGCGCEFRHMGAGKKGTVDFSVPEGWFSEGKSAIEATRCLASIFRGLLGKGAEVDCVDVWVGDDDGVATIIDRNVDLSIIEDAEFRFFENHRFLFSKPTKAQTLQ